MDKLADNYSYVVVDNEAGMEHISRVTTQNVDLLLVVSDPSRRSLQAAKRVDELAKDMGVLRGSAHLILSMVRSEPSQQMLADIKEMGLDLAGSIPDDEQLAEYDLSGKATSTLPEDNPARKAAFAIFEKLISP